MTPAFKHELETLCIISVVLCAAAALVAIGMAMAFWIQWMAVQQYLP